MDNEIFAYWQKHNRSPYHFPMDYDTWLQSWDNDTDSDGRTLFSTLQTDVIRDNTGTIIGLIQYGTTAFGFDPSGEISTDVHYPVIRNLCFEDPDTGAQLLRMAVSHFPASERVYAFFHYFGMSACARHGKLHESNSQVQEVLLANGFIIEHENVYYAKDLTALTAQPGSVALCWKELSPGSCREFAALLQDKEVCWGQIHFLPQGDIAYLRWIYVDGSKQHSGIGTAVMNALFAQLKKMGIHRLDTDTALSNEIAQHFYEKTGFENKGITRSYHTK